MSLQYLALGQEFLPIPRMVRSDLRRGCTVDSYLVLEALPLAIKRQLKDRAKEVVLKNLRPETAAIQ